MALVIRSELFQPGLQFVDPQFFNSMTTMHALVMIFGVVMPAFTGLANWMIPIMVGGPDMALPRMNNWSFWIMPFAFSMLLSTLWMDGGAPAGGWTLYPPLSLQTGDAFPFLIFAIHFMGLSSIMGAINISSNNFKYESARNDINEDAVICLDLVNYSIFIDSCNACVSRWSYYAFNR